MRNEKIVKYFRNHFKSVTKGLSDSEVIELALTVKFNVNKLKEIQ